MFDLTPGPATPYAATKTLEALNNKLFAEPAQWAGVWYDHKAGQIVTAVPQNATQRTLTAAGTTGKVVMVSRSFADLKKISDEIIHRPSIASVPVTSTGMDWEHNAVVVGLEHVTDDARAELASEFGDAVTVQEVGRAVQQNGPDRWRDRYPYWGGSGWAPNGDSGTPACSTAFAVRRPDRSKKFLLTAGHCNSPTAEDAATLNTQSTAWNNLIGTSKGYQNSLCGTKSSCEIGSTKYGDLSVIRVSGIEPRIYSGAARATGSIAVTNTQTSHPAVDSWVCVSGATTGSHCGYRVTTNFTSVRYDDGAVMTPVVQTLNTNGSCTSGGDSGGAVYLPISSGGISASGVHSGSNHDPGSCVTWYTSIYYAHKLFDVVTETS